MKLGAELGLELEMELGERNLKWNLELGTRNLELGTRNMELFGVLGGWVFNKQSKPIFLPSLRTRRGEGH